MKTFVLNRVAQSEKGTFGVLIEGQIPFALTLEPPWLDNKKNISCIPPDEYICKSVNSPKYGYAFRVTRVALRTNILFHQGNIGKNTLGCILVGEQFEPLNGEPAILASQKGYKELMHKLRGLDTFKLVIIESWHAINDLNLRMTEEERTG